MTVHRLIDKSISVDRPSKVYRINRRDAYPYNNIIVWTFTRLFPTRYNYYCSERTTAAIVEYIIISCIYVYVNINTLFLPQHSVELEESVIIFHSQIKPEISSFVST